MDVWLGEGLWVQNSPLLFSLKTSFPQKLPNPGVHGAWGLVSGYALFERVS